MLFYFCTHHIIHLYCTHNSINLGRINQLRIHVVSVSNYVVNLSSAQVSDLCNGGLQRLTIKSYENITEAENICLVGFIVYLNGVAVDYAGDAFAAGSDVGDLSPQVRKYYTEQSHKLLPSLIGYTQSLSDSTLTAVGYAGVGQIGEVWFDDYNSDYPKFLDDDVGFSVIMTEGVQSFVWKNTLYTDRTNNLNVLSSETLITISNVQYAAGWERKDNTWYNGSTVVHNTAATGGDIGTFDLANGLTLMLQGFKANYVVINGATTNEYQTLYGSVTEPVGALAAAMSAGYLKLNQDIVISGQEVYGKVPGFLARKGNSFCWIVTDATVQGRKASLELVNDYGSDDLTATLTQVNDSTYTLQQQAGATLKVPVDGKWHKLPRTLTLKRRK